MLTIIYLESSILETGNLVMKQECNYQANISPKDGEYSSPTTQNHMIRICYHSMRWSGSRWLFFIYCKLLRRIRDPESLASCRIYLCHPVTRPGGREKDLQCSQAEHSYQLWWFWMGSGFFFPDRSTWSHVNLDGICLFTVFQWNTFRLWPRLPSYGWGEINTVLHGVASHC